MNWNYRIHKKTVTTQLRGGPHVYTIYSLREAYYTSKRKIWGVSGSPSIPRGDSIDNLIEVLEQMLGDAKRCKNVEPLIDGGEMKEGSLFDQGCISQTLPCVPEEESAIMKKAHEKIERLENYIKEEPSPKVEIVGKGFGYSSLAERDREVESEIREGRKKIGWIFSSFLLYFIGITLMIYTSFTFTQDHLLQYSFGIALISFAFACYVMSKG
jgi:hypothetical protein